jgi:hypothetical protein
LAGTKIFKKTGEDFMKSMILALGLMLGASSAFAAVYNGRNDRGNNCQIYFTPTGDGRAKVAIVDDHSSTGSVLSEKKIVSSDGLVDTYIVGNSRVRMTVSVFKRVNRISAATFPITNKGFCHVDL